MKGKRFTEQQIIGVLKESGGWSEDKGPVSTPRDLRCDLLQLEGEVRRDDRFGGPPAERARA